jgi:hypothetical protein
MGKRILISIFAHPYHTPNMADNLLSGQHRYEMVRTDIFAPATLSWTLCRRVYFMAQFSGTVL